MKSIKISQIIFFLFFSYVSQIVVGQEKADAAVNLKFKHFSTKDGLSQSSVIEILQDSKGYLWFGTRDGLNKFDGSKFTVYRHNSENQTSLSHSWITSVYEDYDGNLWVGTKDGLNKYNAKADNFKRYENSTKENSISNNEIWDLIQLDSTSLYVSTNNGVDKINISKDEFSHFKHNQSNTNSLSSNQTRGFLKTSNGNLWINTIESIDFLNTKNNTFTHYNYPPETIKEAHINNAPILFRDSKNKIWMGYEHGLAIFNEKDKTFIPYNFDDKVVITSAVRTICEDFFGNLWIGTYKGLYILNREQHKLNKFIHNENDSKSLSQNSIYKIIQDSGGDMWIGTWAGGINYFDRSFDNFKQLSSGATNNMLNYKVISAIIEDSNQNLWIGTEGGGINIYNRNSGLFTYYTNNSNDLNSISSNNVKSLMKDRDGNFWIGTHDGGLNFLNTKKKPYKFEHFKIAQNNAENINNYRILTLLEDENRNIWIGTLTGGLFMYNRASKKFIKLDDTIKSVTCIVQSSDPDVLIFGGTLGVEKININSKRISPISFKNKQNEFGVSKSVICIFEDKNNNYWIGTEGQGLYFYNPNSGETIKYGLADGLPNEVIYSILPDDNNNLWISTNSGISRLNLETKKIKNFDESDGLQSNEFNYGASLKTKKGELIFGGTNGLNYFDPNDIIENVFIPPVDIYEIKVNNKPFLKITDSILKVTLKHNQNDFNIDFVALSFSQANKNNYAYKLEGFDPDWINIGNNKIATYTNLDKGDYIFKVKASNNNGLWNEKGDSIEIAILPAPWKTWWANILYILTTLGILFYFRNLALVRIQEKNELRQEKLDKERIEEVNKLKLKLFTDISHDFRTPLTLIIGPLERMINENKGDEFVQKQHRMMYRNSKMLLGLINQLLDIRKSDAGKLELYASQNNIISFTENIKLSFEELAAQRNIKYIFSSTLENLEVWFDRIKLEKILLNLLSNAFKFTLDNGCIAIDISMAENTSELTFPKFVKLEICNDGKFIPEEHINNIFDRFYQIDEQSKQTGSGIGLSITKSLVELHKGTITVSSTELFGTCFTILLPLGDEHLTEKEHFKVLESTNINEERNKPFYLPEEIGFQDENADSNLIEINKDLPTILIVEDNFEVRKFIKSIFKNKYNTFEAENGEEAIQIAHDEHLDLIISDIMMPVMDGFEFCKQIKTNIKTSHIPVILLTAKSAETHIELGYTIGADAYIIKPFDANLLEVRVNNLLESRKNLISKFKKDLILEPKELTYTSADEEFLKKAIEIIEQNLSDSKFNVYVFSEQMNMSRSVIFRKVKALTDQSISEFIRTVKLKRAGQLLIQTQMNISEIAYEVGFNDLKYFRKCFKNLFKELPSNYRIKFMNNEPEPFNEDDD